MTRGIDNELVDWKNSVLRKPLLLLGARQVGKTWRLKAFGKAHFDHVVYVNFEKEPALRELFLTDLNPQRIVRALSIYANSDIVAGKSLVILDEVQEARNGLTALKYFREEMPELHIAAAGSLLGVALDRTSFPVGQVHLLRLHPLSFPEFLDALGHQRLTEAIRHREWEVLAPFREQLIRLLREYYFVGGMPEAVHIFLEKDDFAAVRKTQLDILEAYENDFAKHAPPEVIPRIRLVWNKVVSQLARENKKFVYGAIKQGARAREYENVVSWLENYGVVHKVYRCTKAAFPLAAYHDVSAFKLYLHDVGLLGALAGLDANVLLEPDRLFQEFKGALTEQFVMQQFVACGHPSLHYWMNDSGAAEVDLLAEHQNTIIAAEIKAAENLLSKSLKVFHTKNPEVKCFRYSLADYRREEWFENVPLWGIAP